jgi:ligand-binding sensor domain-containing protein/signal transduction histidine kinase
MDRSGCRRGNVAAQTRPRVTAFGVWLTLLSSLAPGALAQYQFDSWTTENGLPQNSVNDILQTRDGYLWLATNGGLARFDGARFVTFDRSTEGVKSQRVKTLLEDSQGALWAGTEDGMLIRYRDGKFSTLTVEDGLPQAASSRLEEDEQGNLWATWHGSVTAVTKFDGERFINYRPGDFPHNVNGDPHYRRYPWWSQDAAGLHYLVKGRVQTYSFQSCLPQAQIIRVSADHSGALWIQTRGAGVVKATGGECKRYTTREGLPGNSIEGRFLEDRQGNLWFGEIRIGASLHRIRDGRPEPELAGTFEMFVLYEDREGSLWIGTSGGLYRRRELPITLYTQREGLSLDSTYSIFQGRGGTIWIGTWDKGLNKYERGRFTHYGKAEGLPSGRITCTWEDKAGRLWVGTDAGLSYFRDGRFTSYDDGHGFLKRPVWAMHEDRAGNLWFATDAGLVRLKDGNFTRYTATDGLPHDRIMALFEDRAGALWVGAYQGLSRLKDGVFTSFTEREGFIGNWVRAIYEDGDGVLWVGTYDGGLYRLKDGRLTRYTRKDGLHDNGAFQILEDDAGNLWMGCNRGIYRVSRRELNDFAEGRARSVTSVVYGTKDGLASLECNGGRQPSGLKTADGRLWFPTMGGVAVVDPKAVRPNPAPPPVVIEEFRQGDEVIDFRRGVEIPPNRDDFEIRYTAPSFIKPEHVRFRHRLEGLDDDWRDAGERRAVSYNRIPAGRYRFVVIAANSDGVWNTAGASIEIVVVPPFWRRWWFIALAALGAASALFLLYQRRVGRLREKHAMQQAFSRQLIESQESERQRIAAELHDSLGQYLLVVKNSALLGTKMAEDGSPLREQFDEISARTSQALEEARRIAHHLRPAHLDELGLKDALEFLIETVAASSAIRFSAEIDAVGGVFSKEAEMNLYRIAQEGVSNILKHSGATEAMLALKLDGGKAWLVIKDNGKGFISEPGESAASRRRSFGLAGISERARMLGGRVVIQSLPGQGTVITVTLTVKGDPHEE